MVRVTSHEQTGRISRSGQEGSRMARDEVEERLERLELPFDAYGVDAWGVSRRHLGVLFRLLRPFYRQYFRVRCEGLEYLPANGRAMLVGNHSGGYALDGAMVIASAFFEPDTPRLAQAMAARFINVLPVASTWAVRCGQVPGLPEHAERLLEEERLLVVFPEGTRGTAKLYSERYDLVAFGTGFMRLALKTRTPIIPFGFLGGGAAIPTIANLRGLGRLLGVPYFPVTPYGLPLPLPVRMEVHYGEPMHFKGSGDEEDAVIQSYVDRVRARISELVAVRRRDRWEQERAR
jgi:1-acyl-sn-glycerol-3-phosphate acyltransferase